MFCWREHVLLFFHWSTRTDALYPLFSSDMPWVNCDLFFVFVLLQIARKFSGITELNMPFHQWHFFTITSRQHWKVSVFFSSVVHLSAAIQFVFMFSPFTRPDNLALCLQYLEGYFYDIKGVWSMMTFSDDLMWNLIAVGNWCRQSVFEMNWLYTS